MAIQTKHQTFNGGLATIWSENEDGERTEKLRLPLERRVIGVKRYFEAKTHQSELSELIRVPQQRAIMANDQVRINDEPAIYEVVQVQHIQDVEPPCTDLSLRILEMMADGKQM